VPLKWDYLRVVVPDRVLGSVVQALLDNHVIERDKQYIEGRKSYGYRLCPPYSEARIIRITIEDKPTARRVRAERRSKYKRIRLDVHRYLRSQLRRLEIDVEKATALLQNHPEYEIVKIPVEQIAAGDFTFSVCRFGRVHTDLTRCSRVVRPALHVDGEHLVGIDVANSQPLFLGMLLINYRKKGNKLLSFITFSEQGNPYRKMDDIITETIVPFSQKENNNSTTSTTLSNTTRITNRNELRSRRPQGLTINTLGTKGGAVNKTVLAPDEQHFIRLCEEGRLYEELMDRTEVPVRRWVKEMLFEVFYGKNSSTSPLKGEFSELFPKVAEFIRRMKRKDHRHLSHLMQNAEANFIVNTVCRRLMSELEEAPVFTIHDCLLTTRSYVEQIQDVMREEFTRLGMSAVLHVTDYGE
jgi:hypothetical protein